MSARSTIGSMKTAYLVLAIAGALIPYGFFVQHFSGDGVSLPGFVSAPFANPGPSSPRHAEAIG